MNRYLTTVERTFLHMAERIVMNPVVMVRCRGELEPAAVERAIATVQRRHSALQVRLVHDEQPWFCSSEVPVAALRVVARNGDEHWRELVREELNTPFDQQRGPLIRFVLLRSAYASELLCTTDHLNADGRSGLFVLRDVLRAIEDPTLRMLPLADRGCFDDHLPGGLFDLGRMPRALRGIVADRARTLGRIAKGYVDERSRLRGRPRTAKQPRPRIEFVHQRLGSKRTQALVEACRAHDTTVQGALMVAASHALAWARGVYAQPRATARIGCITPIDIRSALTPPVGDHFGIFAWAPTTIQSLRRGASFWSLAERSRATLRALHGQPALAGLRRLLDLHELTLGSGLEALSGLPLAVCDGAITVSNLGRVELPKWVGDVEVVSFGFFAMIPDGDAVVAVQTYNQLELNYCYCEDRISTELMHEVMVAVADVVDAAIGGSRRGAAELLEF
jgi:hypothetical protein